MWAPKGFCGRDQGCAFPTHFSSKKEGGPGLRAPWPQAASYQEPPMHRQSFCFSSRPVKCIPGLRLRGVRKAQEEEGKG